MLFTIVVSNKLTAQSTNYKAYSLYVYNFMKYVEWPEEESKGDFIVGLIGDSKIKEDLSVLANNKKLKGRKIVFKVFDKVEDITYCHLIYVSSSKSSSIKVINKKFANKPLLIVGEREESVYKGAALSFLTTDEDELKFDINKKEIESHKLKISSSLIKLGTLIN
ncbi:MAG: YfiR family protein [Bacteroidia bacterium]